MVQAYTLETNERISKMKLILILYTRHDHVTHKYDSAQTMLLLLMINRIFIYYMEEVFATVPEW